VLVALDLRIKEGNWDAGGHKRDLREIKLGESAAAPSRASTEKRPKPPL
jgi:hypothetical protein